MSSFASAGRGSEQFVLVPSIDGRGCASGCAHRDAEGRRCARCRGRLHLRGEPRLVDARRSAPEHSRRPRRPRASGPTSPKPSSTSSGGTGCAPGPFVNESDARQALANSRGEFPKAWLAVSDDETLNEIGIPSARRDRAVDSRRASTRR